MFLRGIRKSIIEVVPKPLDPFGEAPLSDFLGPFPNIDRTHLSENLQKNLRSYESLIRARSQAGTLQADDIVTVQLDRAAGKVWKQTLVCNAVPTLTTQNHYLFVDIRRFL